MCVRDGGLSSRSWTLDEETPGTLRTERDQVAGIVLVFVKLAADPRTLVPLLVELGSKRWATAIDRFTVTESVAVVLIGHGKIAVTASASGPVH